MSETLGDSADSQKMDLKWTSVWRAKCKEFHKKMKDFGASGVQGQREFAENGLKVDLSMESKM